MTTKTSRPAIVALMTASCGARNCCRPNTVRSVYGPWDAGSPSRVSAKLYGCSAGSWANPTCCTLGDHGKRAVHSAAVSPSGRPGPDAADADALSTSWRLATRPRPHCHVHISGGGMPSAVGPGGAHLRRRRLRWVRSAICWLTAASSDSTASSSACSSVRQRVGTEWDKSGGLRRGAREGQRTRTSRRRCRSSSCRLGAVDDAPAASSRSP